MLCLLRCIGYQFRCLRNGACKVLRGALQNIISGDIKAMLRTSFALDRLLCERLSWHGLDQNRPTANAVFSDDKANQEALVGC